MFGRISANPAVRETGEKWQNRNPAVRDMGGKVVKPAAASAVAATLPFKVKVHMRSLPCVTAEFVKR